MTPGSIIITTWAIIVLFCLIVIYPFLLILSLLRPHSVDIYLVALAIFVFGTPLLFASLTYILKVARVDFYRSWPFIYFWRFFTIRPKRRGWTVQDQSYSRAERHLCSTCTNISSRSKLLIGSKLIFTWRTEWHEINNTLDGLDPSGQSGCHFCSILWHSVPDFIRREDPIEDARPEEQPVVRSHWFYLFHRRTQKPLQRGTKLRLKIWEELEGLRYKQHECFVQLYRGKVPLCKGIPIKKGFWICISHLSLALKGIRSTVPPQPRQKTLNINTRSSLYVACSLLDSQMRHVRRARSLQCPMGTARFPAYQAHLCRRKYQIKWPSPPCYRDQRPWDSVSCTQSLLGENQVLDIERGEQERYASEYWLWLASFQF